MKYLHILLICLSSIYSKTILSQSVFITKPYLQIGYDGSPNKLALLWHTADTTSEWGVEVKLNNSWVKSTKIYFNRVFLKSYQPFVVYHATLQNLPNGKDVSYRVLKNKVAVFESFAHAPKSKSQNHKFVVAGDIGALTLNQKKLANVMYDLNPDFVAVPGDIVYGHGLVNEYATKYWPIYNADNNDSTGAPLLRTIPFMASVGNHDANDRDMDKTPEALAYYYFWEQPLNGPYDKEGSDLLPILKGSESNRNAFYEAAKNAYPKMTNFSYDYGNAHWTVIDADHYVNWSNKELQNWIIQDLKKSAKAKWHFVMFHQPGFNSSKAHFEEQHMRLLSPIFEAGNVDVVFNGHVHNYQRSFPLTFIPDTMDASGTRVKIKIDGKLGGKWTLDKNFDGSKNKKPKGVIYIVTGAGGQRLYNTEQTNLPTSWQPFTDKFISTDNTISFIEVVKNKFQFKQINTKGETVDSFIIEK